MNERDFINLIHDVERHEDAVTEDVKQIKELKVDVWELLNLVRLMDLFMQRQLAGGIVQDKAEVEFRNRLRAILDKHGIEG
jgi:hypothetical protein